MKVWVLRKLRTEARTWWYHAQLRQRGSVAEAGERERASIRFQRDIIRQALANDGAYIGTDGKAITIHYACRYVLSSHGGLAGTAMAQVLVDAGLPLIDTTPVPDKWQLTKLPLVAIGEAPDAAPWSRLSFAPLAAYAARARALGAVVTNPPAGMDTPAA